MNSVPVWNGIVYNAVRFSSVEKAAPFPNVPPGLIDKKDGLVKFTFHFLVTVGEQPIFRMRRYQ